MITSQALEKTARELIKASSDIQLFTMNLPREYNGPQGKDRLYQAVIRLIDSYRLLNEIADLINPFCHPKECGCTDCILGNTLK